MTTDEQLRDAFEKWREGARQAQLRWVTVDKVDKENKSMDVTGVIDRLEYYDVQLGMGHYASIRNRERLVWSESSRDRRLTPS